MDKKVCQSCGMALGDPGFYGTNPDESRNEDYCIYCFAGGEFNEELTLDEMVDQCAGMDTDGERKSEEEALASRTRIREFLCTLKRWRQDLP